jgi:hypothetical protein
MLKKGKVIQIIKNNKLANYFGGNIITEMIKTGKDLVVLCNPEYPSGWKGYFMSFTKNHIEEAFPILMDSTNIKLGQELKIQCETFIVPTEFYIKR